MNNSRRRDGRVDRLLVESLQTDTDSRLEPQRRPMTGPVTTGWGSYEVKLGVRPSNVHETFMTAHRPAVNVA